MKAIEYTERLIEDVYRSAKIRETIPSPHMQAQMTSITGESNLEHLCSAINVWILDHHLSMLSQDINAKKKLINHKKGDTVNIETWLKDLNSNKEQIKKALMDILSQSKDPAKSYLIKELNYIHEASF